MVLSTATAAGAGLKGFLEFAERGKLAVVQHSSCANHTEDTLPAEIAAAVSEIGYKVKCNIGCSEFKVDIGIVDPENENEYLLGILLDGENNTNSSTARDRFILQPSVLQELGWNIIRVWSLDWFDDKERVLKNIKTAVDNIPTREKAETATVKPAVFAGVNFERNETITLPQKRTYARS